ncbi:MAG: LytR/AlgR family response regulator transcription factor [Crocinitomicaceae bacterium]
MKVVVIEDQLPLRKNLIYQIRESNLGFNVVGEASSVTEGTRAILQTSPDIVFFDIEIIEGSSFEILDALPALNFKSVFVTAYDHFAIKAIKYSAFDFLLKPFKPEELIQTLLKLKKTIHTKDDYKSKFEILFNELKGKENPKIAISSLESVRYIMTNNIIRLEADSSYCSIHLVGGEVIVSSKNMKHYELVLPAHNFIKVHRSHIINTNMITAILKNDGGSIKLINNDEVPISRRKKEEFLELIKRKMTK